MKKIFVVSNYFTPEIGAAPNRITSLTDSLLENGYKVTVFCPMPNYPYGEIFNGYKWRLWKVENQKNLKVVRLWTYPSVSKKAIPRIVSMLSFSVVLSVALMLQVFTKPKMAIVQSPPLLVSLAGILVSRKILGIKTILNVSDLWPRSAVELGVLKPGKFHNILLRIEKIIYNYSDAIICQSNEIQEHVSRFTDAPKFIYRNLPKQQIEVRSDELLNKPKKVVYAGLLGFAQGVLKIAKDIDFESLGIEFHIYGKGMEEEEIALFCKSNESRPIYFHGAFQPSEAYRVLSKYDAAIVPLTNRIYGAVPSKIFELIFFEVPILFSGGGEGQKIVEKYQLGLTCEPGNLESMKSMLHQFKDWSLQEHLQVKRNFKIVKDKEFDYQKQFNELIQFIENE